MKPVSLADITYEQGLKLLALRKQAMDQGRIRRMTPEALGNTLVLRDIGHSYVEKMAEGSWLDSLKSGIGQIGQQAKTGLGQAQNYFQNLDPASRNTLLAGLAGTGLGAAAGLGQAAMSGDDNYLTSALRGGVAGGALGGGLGLAMNPGIADKLYAQGKSIYDKAQQQAKPPAGQAPAGQAPAAPPSREELDKLYGEANSYAPEAVLGGGLAGTAAGTGYGIAKSLNRQTYDPNALAELLKNRAKSLKPGGPGIAEFNELMTGGKSDFHKQLLEPGPVRPSTRFGASSGETMGVSDDVLKQQIAKQLKAQGHTPSWLQTLFGRSNNPAFRAGKDTLNQASRALGSSSDDVLKQIVQSGIRGRNPRAIIPSLIATLGTTAAGALLGNYQNQRADRAQAQQEYGNLADQYINNQ